MREVGGDNEVLEGRSQRICVRIWKSLFRNSMRHEEVGYVTYGELRDVEIISG